MAAPDFSMLVDVVDSNNRPISRTTRARLLEQRLNFRTVHVLLEDCRGFIILQELPLNHPRNPGRLGSSVAGYVRAGETYRRAAYRKLRSELGLDCALGWVGMLRMTDEGSRKFVGLYKGRTTQTPIFDRSEIARLVYIEPNHLADLVRLNQTLFTATFLHVYKRYERQELK